MTTPQEKRAQPSQKSSKTWEERREQLEKDANRINESFRYYRGSAIGLSVTMVGISVGALASLKDLSTISYISKFGLLVLFSSVIVLSCLLQYLNYWGHYRLAHYLMWQSMANSANASGTPPTKDEKSRIDEISRRATRLWKSHIRYFRALEITLHFSFGLLVLSVVYLAVQLDAILSTPSP